MDNRRHRCNCGDAGLHCLGHGKYTFRFINFCVVNNFQVQALPKNGGEKNYLEYLFRKPKYLITSMYAANALLLGMSVLAGCLNLVLTHPYQLIRLEILWYSESTSSKLLTRTPGGGHCVSSALDA